MTAADQAARDQIELEHDQTLFVDAGAGTGKTTALVARVVSLVEEGHLTSVRELAAITFTENAATELRTKIREALEFAARQPTGDKAANCARAVSELDDAAITTLHGFAARLLMDAPLEAGLPFGFGIDDAIRASIVRDRWWRGVLDEMLANPTLAETWRGAFTLGMKHWDLEKIVSAFDANWDLLGDAFAAAPAEQINVPSLLRPLGELRDYCAGQGPAGDALTLRVDTVLMPALAEAEHGADGLQVLALLSGLKISSNVGNAPAWQASGLDKTVALGHCKATSAAVESAVDAHRGGIATTLVEYVRHAVRQHACERQRVGRLWFHDLLVLAVRMLREEADVRAAMHARWMKILVDEFQDTDPLQVELVHLIAGGGETSWRQQQVEGGRLFFVGDPKQSIYRFRRAEVQLFGEVRGKVGAAASSRETIPQPTLTENFRSRPGVIKAVNTAFATLFAADPLVPHTELVAHREPVTDPGPDVLLLGGPHDANMSVIREAEAQHVAATLRRAREDKWLVSERDEPQPRPATYADMAILVPTRTSLSALEDALDREAVPYRIMSRSLVWRTDAVRDLVSVLQVIDDPTDAVALVAALRHPMLACSDDDLAAWAVGGGAWRYDAPAPPTLSTSRVAQAMEVLRGYHDVRWWLPVNVLLDRIVRERRVVELTSAHQRPRDHWRRLRFVTDQARAFLDSGGTGLTAFLRWAHEQIEGDADAVETVAPERDDDAVQILTIHGSKGLEFPIVALTGINVAPRNDSPVLWRPGAVPAVRPRKGFETAGYEDAKAQEKAQAAAEEVRLLYVGMTRAMDHLVVSLHHKATGGGDNHAVRLHHLMEPLMTAGAVHEAAPTPAPASPASKDSVAATTTAGPDRQTFLAERSASLAAARASLPTTATGLVVEAGEEAVKQEPADPLTGVSSPEAADEPLPRPVARTGATLGSAVHRALELVDLSTKDDAVILAAAAGACAELGVPRLMSEVVARVRAALASDIVQAAAVARHWKEVPIVAELDGRIVEGLIDLLYETPDGLVVVDYKTDGVRSSADIDTLASHYSPQLSAYARGVSEATSRDVVAAILLFVGQAETHAHNVLWDGRSARYD